MIGKKNRPESEISRRIEAVRTSEEKSFRAICVEGGFDLATDLRYQNLSGLSFAGEDLRNINFTGSNLCSCDFTDAQLAGAVFCRSRLGDLLTGQHTCADLRRAADWVDFVQPFKLKSFAERMAGRHDGSDEEESLPDGGDNHLPIGAVFQDAPTLPLMVSLPVATLEPLSSAPKRLAVSQGSLSNAEDSPLRWWRGFTDNPSSSELDDYAEWASEMSNRQYRWIKESDWEMLCRRSGCVIDTRGGVASIISLGTPRFERESAHLPLLSGEIAGIKLSRQIDTALGVEPTGPVWMLRIMK